MDLYSSVEVNTGWTCIDNWEVKNPQKYLLGEPNVTRQSTRRRRGRKYTTYTTEVDGREDRVFWCGLDSAGFKVCLLAGSSEHNSLRFLWVGGWEGGNTWPAERLLVSQGLFSTQLENKAH